MVGLLLIVIQVINQSIEVDFKYCLMDFQRKAVADFVEAELASTFDKDELSFKCVKERTLQ